MSNFTDFISSGGAATFPTFFLYTSQTWVPPQDGNICIHVVGAGGSGSWSADEQRNAARGGGGGGYCKKNSLAVTTAGSFTVVVGTGGASGGGTNGVNNGNVSFGNGISGGASTVAGTGLGSTLTANGGGFGNRLGTSSTGGTASGGDVNNTGGTAAAWCGGGGVNLNGTGAYNATSNSTRFAKAGEASIQGDFKESAGGILYGGQAGNLQYLAGQYINRMSNFSNHNGGPLAGGGSLHAPRQSSGTGLMWGGHGGLGGGGGACTSYYDTDAAGGRGGDGVVVIQYLS